MAIIVATEKQWGALFAPVPQVKHRKRRRSKGKGLVYRFRRIGRAFQNRQGPGRKTKRMKNATITHL